MGNFSIYVLETCVTTVYLSNLIAKNIQVECEACVTEVSLSNLMAKNIQVERNK